MRTQLNTLTDGYERKARLYPALLLVAPAIAAGVAIFSARLGGLQSLAVGMAGCGGSFLFTQLARDSGKRAESFLFAKWGGLPSIALFRHRDARLDAVTKARYHKKLAVLVKEAKAPTPEMELSDPDAADVIYSAWSNFLRSNTRDRRRFALLFQENVNYGYRRNVWGLRPLGIAVSAFSLVSVGVRLCFIYSTTAAIDGALGGAGIFAASMLILWIFRFNDDWVRIPADAYAERLAEAVESLPVRSTTKRA